MKRCPVTAHLSAAEVGRCYRHCPDPTEMTRWPLAWLPLQGPTLTCERAGPRAGLSDTPARTVLKRWNARVVINSRSWLFRPFSGSPGMPFS